MVQTVPAGHLLLKEQLGTNRTGLGELSYINSPGGNLTSAGLVWSHDVMMTVLRALPLTFVLMESHEPRNIHLKENWYCEEQEANLKFLMRWWETSQLPVLYPGLVKLTAELPLKETKLPCTKLKWNSI